MQDGAEGDVRMGGDGVPERDGAMGGKLGQEPFRQRLDRIAVVIVLGRDRVEAAVEDDCRDAGSAGHRRLARHGRGFLVLIGPVLIGGGLVFGADIAALDVEAAVAIQADENAGPRNLGRVEPDGAIVERLDLGFEFAETLIDLVGQLVGLGVLRLERVEFRLQGGAARGFLLAHLDGFAFELAQAVGVAVGEIDGDRDPFPAFGGQGLGFLLQLVLDQAVEQGRVLQPAAAIVLEKIAGELAAGRLIGLDADKRGAAVIGGVDGGFGQHAADLMGCRVVAVLHRLPDLFLARMVGGEGEGHDVLERHLLGDVELEKPGRDGGEAQALPDDLRRDEETRRDVVFGEALVDQRLEGAELVDGVQGLALRVLGEGIFLGDAGIAHDAGDGHGLVQALGLHKAFEGAIAPAAGRDLVEAGFFAVRADDGADIEVLQQAAAGDVLGQCLDRHAGLHGADVGLAQDQLVEGDLADNGEGLDLGRFSHGSDAP